MLLVLFNKDPFKKILTNIKVTILKLIYIIKNKVKSAYQISIERKQ